MDDAMGTAQPERLHTGRVLGGWAAVYGQIGEDGTVHPTVDRQRQTIEAAGSPESISWDRLLKVGVGVINERHRRGPDRRVGVPLGVEYHDGTTPLSLAHRKVGWWLWFKLFDPDDPDSWAGMEPPTAVEQKRANYYWELAPLLLAAGRPLGLSIQGGSRASPDGSAILHAFVDEVAVVEYPSNPDCTVEHVGPVALPLAKGVETSRAVDPEGDAPQDEESALVKEVIARLERLDPGVLSRVLSRKALARLVLRRLKEWRARDVRSTREGGDSDGGDP